MELFASEKSFESILESETTATILMVRRYLKYTNMPQTTLGRTLFNDPTYFSAVFAGQRNISINKNILIKHFILANPEGIPGKDYKDKSSHTFVRGSDVDKSYQSPLEIAVSRDPCNYCGVNGNYGCKHRAPLEPQNPISLI